MHHHVIPVSISLCTMMFHIWTPTFNFDSLVRHKLPIWISSQMLPLELKPIEVAIVGQIGSRLIHDWGPQKKKRLS
jgi:hypothetical protein